MATCEACGGELNAAGWCRDPKDGGCIFYGGPGPLGVEHGRIDPDWRRLVERATERMGTVECSEFNGEARLRRCARCGADAEGINGHPMYGVLVDDLGSVPVVTVVREVARTRLLVRLRLCNPCHVEAMAYAHEFSPNPRPQEALGVPSPDGAGGPSQETGA